MYMSHICRHNQIAAKSICRTEISGCPPPPHLGKTENAKGKKSVLYMLASNNVSVQTQHD